jgi:hypothetical protein
MSERSEANEGGMSCGDAVLGAVCSCGPVAFSVWDICRVVRGNSV